MKDNHVLHGGESPTTSTSQKSRASPRKRILVVDDDNLIRQLSTEVLIQSGYEVDTAEDGDAAWQALHTGSYDLLITDHNMPKITGVELVRKLRAARMALPVVMAAGRLPMHELARTPSLRLSAMLWKPYTVGALLVAVKNALRATAGTRERSAPPPRLQSRQSTDRLAL